MRGNFSAVRRAAVPAGHPGHHRPHRGAADPPDALGAEVGVELIPGVPHRRQAIAEVRGAGGAHDRLRAAMAEADDGVEPIEGELLDRNREKRQVMPVVALD